MNLKKKKKTVKELGLELKVENDSEELDKENTIITEQSPKEGVTVNKGSNLYVKY